MFYCNSCADKEDWPKSIGKSHGKCEMCDAVGVCNDLPTCPLPRPKPFVEFWYESNACWGWVSNLDDLEEKLELQLARNNGIDTIDDFLDNSRQFGDGKNYGTRGEHNGETLRVFLERNGVLEDFLKVKEIND